MKLVVVGPSQSGKSCLAGGLGKTSYGKALFKSAFVATAKGNTSRDYITKLQLMLEGAVWPDATKDSKAKTIDFEFQSKNKKVEFSFDDYNGENVTQKEFRKKLENLCEEDGVALLVNTGFSYSYIEEPTGDRRLATDAEVVNGKTDSGLPVLKASAFEDSPLARKWLVELEKIYEQLIEDLSTQNGGDKSGKPVVALTVTASDRLNSDLSNIRPCFEAFLEKIKNRLDAGGFKCKKFEVSITGILKDQAKPKLADGLANTSAKPFLWLLGKLAWRVRIQVWAKRAMCISAIAAVFTLCVGTYLWFDADKNAENIRNWETQCKNILAKTESDSTNVKGELTKAIEQYKLLRTHRGFGEQKANECADRLEYRIWCVQKRLIEDKIRRIEESQGEKGNVTDCNQVESLFGIFAPSSPSNATALAHSKLRDMWNMNKESFQEANYKWQLGEKVRKPLRKLGEDHGVAVIGKLYPLYDTILAIEVKSHNIELVKMELSTNIDLRVENEWRKFAIPDFELASSTNATHANTRKFFDLFCAWSPATTNGIAAKDKLMVAITNSIPKWRNVYEKTTFKAKVENAVRSREMTELAELHPTRIATNEYLTAKYITEQWTNRVQGIYEEVYQKYIERLVSSCVGRPGCPSLSNDDEEQIKKKAAAVGAPFDVTNALAVIRNKVYEKAEGWRAEKQKTCRDWIKKEVQQDKKRAGQGSLWDAYTYFVRNNQGNPFIGTDVLPAVYKQVEDWLESDIQAFKDLDCNSNSYRQDAEELYNNFKKLCREVFRRNTKGIELKTSWACHFAIACEKDGHLEGVNKCFPQTLAISNVEGKICYIDFRVNYTGTDLTAIITITSTDGSEEKYQIVSKQTLGKEGNYNWKPIVFAARDITIHPFDIIKVELIVTDKNRVGRNLEGEVPGPMYLYGVKLKERLTDGLEVGGEFDLRNWTKFVGKGHWYQGKLTTKDPTPDAYIKIQGDVIGKSVDVYVAEAKKKAMNAKEEERKAK